MEVSIILGQDAYELQRPLDYKIGTRSEPFAVLTELGWVVIGHMTGKRRQNVCHFAFTEDVKVAIQTCEYPNLVGHRNLCFQNQRSPSVKEGTAGTDAREYDEIHRRTVRSGNAVGRTRAKPTE